MTQSDGVTVGFDGQSFRTDQFVVDNGKIDDTHRLERVQGFAAAKEHALALSRIEDNRDLGFDVFANVLLENRTSLLFLLLRAVNGGIIYPEKPLTLKIQWDD